MPQTPTALVVDDEPLLCKIYNHILSKELTVKVVASAEEAMAALEEHGPVPLLITDQVMPGQHGSELAAVVQKRWPTTVVVAVTAFAKTEVVRKAAAVGLFHAVVPKPFAMPELRKVLEAALAEHGRRKRASAH